LVETLLKSTFQRIVMLLETSAEIMRTFVMNSLSFRKFTLRPQQWLWAVLIGVLLVVCSPFPAIAAITQLEESPGQLLYQSRQTLHDQTGKSWQVVAFKRIYPDGRAMLSLRLVGFPGAVELDHTQPLTLATALGQTLTAKDVTSAISQHPPTLGNVGEYDLKPVLPQLRSDIPLQLTLPVLAGSAIELPIPSRAIQEWQILSAR
jgi:Protein of unknown function (DUF3122)